MFEYHAWVTVHSSPGDEEDADLKAAFDATEREVQPLQGGTTEASLRWVNGAAQLHISGFLNHRSGEGQQVIECFQRIAKVAPGSYGVLYIRDDEDSSGRNNEFQVVVMRRGAIFAAADNFLSPCVPVIEDE
jgi:Immunity protein 7